MDYWLDNQKEAFRGKIGYKLTYNKIKLLEDIGIQWFTINTDKKLQKEEITSKNILRKKKEILNRVKLFFVKKDPNSYYFTSKKDIEELNNEFLDSLKPTGYVKCESKWYKNYELAKKYYNYHGNLDIPQIFKTKNGYEYDEKGDKLGYWISTQRRAYKGDCTRRLTYEQIKLLEDIEMQWFLIKNTDEKLRKEEITSNNIIQKKIEILNRTRSLLISLENQRLTNIESKEDIEKINEEFIRRLNNINEHKIIKTNKNIDQWNKMYNLAKAYYKHYGNLNINRDFKTKNGYEPDKNGLHLGEWIDHQRQAYKGHGTYRITEEQIKLLEDIGMIFNPYEHQWNKMYNLAKAYYTHHGNLNIDRDFKTKNGYDYNDEGFKLGEWITTQKRRYNGKSKYKLTKKQIKLLEDIGMIFNQIDNQWNEKYNLAKAYYAHHGNLNINRNFKTTNGYEYDASGIPLGEWIHTQRKAYKGQVPSDLTEERIELLEHIGIEWFLNNTNEKLQKEDITSKNILRKQKEILNRARSLFISLEKQGLTNFESKEDIEKINEKFMRTLSKK